jgi:hypothetical protein
MDQHLSDLLWELREAINEAVLNSERLAKAMAALERDGRDARIAMDISLVDDGLPQESRQTVSPADSEVRLTLNSFDMLFLRTLRISVETAEEREPASPVAQSLGSNDSPSSAKGPTSA